MSDLFTQIKSELAGMDVLIHEQAPLSHYTTFRVGGCARMLLCPQNTEALIAICACLQDKEVPVFILGNGSNVVFADEGYQGVVVSTRAQKEEIRVEADRLLCTAGTSMSAISVKAYEHSLYGLAFAQGIPGTVGGAIYMNAGAYTGEICQVISRSRYIDEQGVIGAYVGEEHQFGYRKSVYTNTHKIILDAEFQLAYGDQEQIKGKMDLYRYKRSSRQPLEYPSAGSFFKRPEGHFAAKLIEDAGLKGLRVGGAEVSRKHSGFVINAGGATAQDLLDLCALVQEKVYDFAGVKLEREVRFVTREGKVF